MARRFAALPNLTVSSPLRQRRKLRGSSGERPGKFTLPATGSPRAGAPLCKVDEVHAILEGLTQTSEEKQRVEDEAQLRQQTMVDLEHHVERMLEERDVDAAFEVLRRNLWKATRSHRDNRNGSATSHSETIFKLVLRHSANSRWKFEITQQRIIPFLCEALTSSGGVPIGSPVMRTSALYALANLTSDDLCIDRLMIEGVLRVFFDIAFRYLESVGHTTDDNQRQETLWMASFCHLANYKDPSGQAQRCHNLGVVATLALVNVANVTVMWSEQVDRFRFVEQGGLELLLRFAGQQRMQETAPEVVEQIMTMLRKYSHRDLTRFKRRGKWRHGETSAANKVLQGLLARTASLRNEQNAREELGRAAQALVCNYADPAVLVDRLDAVKLVAEIELEGGFQTVQLPVSPRTTLTPSLTRAQIEYVAWTERIRALTDSGNHTELVQGARGFMAKVRLEHTQATAECDKVHATIIQMGHRSDPKDTYAQDVFRLRDSTARVLSVAESQLHLAEAIYSAVSAGCTVETMASSTDIHILEHVELVAQRVLALETQKKKDCHRGHRDTTHSCEKKKVRSC